MDNGFLENHEKEDGSPYHEEQFFDKDGDDFYDSDFDEDYFSKKVESWSLEYDKTGKFPQEVNQIIKDVLSANGLIEHLSVFKDNVLGFPLIVNLINFSAKSIDRSWYDFKPAFVKFMQYIHPETWVHEDDSSVIVARTPFGEVSFHVFSDEVERSEIYGQIPVPGKTNENDFGTQGKAVELIEDFVADYIGRSNEEDK